MIEEVKTKTMYPYSSNPEWKDVNPIKQNEGSNLVLNIAYTKQFSETMDYFRAILQMNEVSERAFRLTAEVIELNSANYTAWHFRRVCLKELNYDLIEELNFITKIAEDSLKNYQLWFHRRKIIEWIDKPMNELNYISDVLTIDSKNYHVWSHRFWVCEHFNLWDQELNFTEKLIDEDIKNNSAWNHRFYSIKNFMGFAKDTIESEIKFVLKKIDLEPDNESSWNYLRGLIDSCKFIDVNRIKTFIKKKIDKGKYVHAYSLLVDILVIENTKESKDDAIKYCESLEKEVDTIRDKYWKFVATTIVGDD